MADTSVVGGENGCGEWSDDGGFAVGLSKGVDGFERAPQGENGDFDFAGVGALEQVRTNVAGDAAKLGEDAFVEVAFVRGPVLSSRAGGPKTRDHGGRLGSAAAGDGGDQKDAVAFFEAAGFAAEEANVFLVEVDVEELADLAAVVADVAGELWELRGERVQSFGDRGGATVNLGRAVGEAAKGCGDFDGDGHGLVRLLCAESKVGERVESRKLKVESGRCGVARADAVVAVGTRKGE